MHTKCEGKVDVSLRENLGRNPMKQKKIVDGHAHACGEYLTVESIRKKLECAGVDQVLLTPGQNGSKVTYGLACLAKRNPLGDCVSKNNKTTAFLMKLIGGIRGIPQGNEIVYQLRQQLPDKVLQCYWVTKENVERLQKDYERMDFRTVKLHQCWETFEIADEFFQRVAQWAEEKQMPLFIHVKTKEQMEHLIQYIKSHPRAIMIVGHLYAVELFMQYDMAYFENVYFDLSNYYFVSKERIRLACDHFGADHFLLGSDTPYGKQSLEKTLELIRNVGFNEEEERKIMGENLLRIIS